jgi:nitrate reductase NapE component
MLLDQNTFDTKTASLLSPEAPPADVPASAGTTAEAAAKERREQDKALALMISYVLALVLAVTFWGGQGLMGWALMSAALAGAWVLHTTRGIRGTADE